MEIKFSEKDKCVLCWNETEYDNTVPVSNRQFYIEGCGQLCQNCWHKLYSKKEINVIESDNYILNDNSIDND